MSKKTKDNRSSLLLSYIPDEKNKRLSNSFCSVSKISKEFAKCQKNNAKKSNDNRLYENMKFSKQ